MGIILLSSRPIAPRILLSLGLLCGLLLPLAAQKVLQIERYGSMKTRKFHIGDELTFSLRAEPRQYYTRTIQDLYPEGGTIQFVGGAIQAADIAAIRFTGSNRWAKNLSNGILSFTGVWVLYSILDTLINSRAPTRFQYIVGGSALGAAGILGWLIPERVVRFGDRRRLRILDLTFYPDAPIRP
jgi:hypothetical protein